MVTHGKPRVKSHFKINKNKLEIKNRKEIETCDEIGPASGRPDVWPPISRAAIDRCEDLVVGERNQKKKKKRKRKIDTAEFHYNSAGTRNSTQDDPLESDERKDEKKRIFFSPTPTKRKKKKMASEDPVDHRLS